MRAEKHCRLLLKFLGNLFLASGILYSGTAKAETPGSAEASTDVITNASTSADFYVAFNGNDAWPGTLSQPFRTVDRARIAIKAIKTKVSGRPLVVRIRQGTYYLLSTWTFTSEDSGTRTTPVVYANYPGETPVISGGRLITNWSQAANGSWKATLPSGVYFTQLWVNGARRYRPRTTPTGYLYITGEYSTTGSTTQVNQLSYSTRAATDVPNNMANLSDVELINFEAWDVPHMRIVSVNTSTKRIVTNASLPKNSFFFDSFQGIGFFWRT